MTAMNPAQVSTLPSETNGKEPKQYPTCANCGGPVTKHLFPSRRKKDLLWCSFPCYKYKPRRVVLLEIRFGKGDHRKDIRDILIDTTRQYGNHNTQAKALSVSVPYFFMMIERYFFMNMDDFMLKYATGARLKRYQQAEVRKKAKKERVRKAKLALAKRGTNP